MIKIYGAKAPWPFLKGVIRDIRPVWLMEEMGKPYERISLDPMKGETRSESYMTLNPFGKIPSLEDGDFKLFQSTTICTYLADKFDDWIPKVGTKDRALHDQWTTLIIADIEPLTARVFRSRHMMKEEPHEAEWLQKSCWQTLNWFFKIIEMRFEKQKYLLGAEPQVADLILAANLRSVYTEDAMKQFPRLSAWTHAMFDRPAFKKAYELNGT